MWRFHPKIEIGSNVDGLKLFSDENEFFFDLKDRHFVILLLPEPDLGRLTGEGNGGVLVGVCYVLIQDIPA